MREKHSCKRRIVFAVFIGLILGIVLTGRMAMDAINDAKSDLERAPACSTISVKVLEKVRQSECYGLPQESCSFTEGCVPHYLFGSSCETCQDVRSVYADCWPIADAHIIDDTCGDVWCNNLNNVNATCNSLYRFWLYPNAISAQN